MAAYLAEERRHDPHSVVKEQSLPGKLGNPWSTGVPVLTGPAGRSAVVQFRT